MNPENIKDTIQIISETLTPLAEKIGKTGEYVFELAIRQVYVNAITKGIALIVVIFLIILYIKLFKWAKKQEEYDDEAVSAAMLVSGVFLVIASILIPLMAISSIIQAIFNPEYQAIVNILKMVE